ncbi:MAG: hypothetical protein ABUT20_14105 [Bacteroidota bacterium]
MKTNRTMTLIAGLFFSTVLIFSCQKEKSTTQTPEPVSFKAATSSSIIPESEVILPDCHSVCINEAGPYNETSGMSTQSWGGPNSDFHTKTVSYVAYNTATDFVVKVTYVKSGLNTNASNLVRATVNGVIQSVTTLASGATATFTFPLPSGWKKCDLITLAIRQEGQNSPVDLSGTYNLYEVCPAAKVCETSFTGEAISCGTSREVVYKFSSKDGVSYFKMQGGLTNFTGTNATVYINGKVVDFNSEVTEGASTWITGTVDSYTIGQRSPGGSSNRNIRVIGGLSGCSEVIVRIVWNSTNSGGIITGDWSVKDAHGADLATAIAGLQCQ